VGHFSGLTTAEIAEKFPSSWEARVNGVLNPPGGERYEHFYERAARAFGELTAVYQHSETVAIISHGGTLAAVIAHVLGIPPTQHPKFSLRGNTGISTIEVNDHGTALLGLNDTWHLNHL
jgi:broad specificity phosphatase PhoE